MTERWGPRLLLVAVIALHLLVVRHWIAEDQSVAPPLDASNIHQLSGLIQAQQTGDLLRPDKLEQPGLMSWIGLAVWNVFGHDPDTLKWLLVAAIALAQLAAFDVGARLHSRWAGVLAATVVPLAPDVTWMSQRWFPGAFHILCMLLVLALLVRSRSLSRPLPVLGMAIVLAAGSVMGVMHTNNACFLIAAGGMIAVAMVRGIVLGRGPLERERAARWRPLVGGVFLLAVIWSVCHQVQFFGTNLAYLTGEMANPVFAEGASPWSWRALTAYPRYLAITGLSPLLAVPLAVAFVPFVRRGPARAELLGGIVLTLLALSLISKKNTYYLLCIHAYLPVVIAVGLFHVRPRFLRIALVAATLFFGGSRWVVNWAHPPPPLLGALLCPLLMGRHQSDLTVVFEMPAVPMLDTQTPYAHQREVDFVEALLPGDTCPDPLILGWISEHNADNDQTEFLLLRHNPCLLLRGLPARADFPWEPERADSKASWILVQDDTCALGAPAPRNADSEGVPSTVAGLTGAWDRLEGDRRVTRVATALDGSPCLYMYRL